MTERIIPRPLKPGDRAALIAASSPVTRVALDVAVRSLAFLGLKPVVMTSCSCAPPRPWLSASDRQRADDVTTALMNPEIKGIFFVRGGYGSARIAPLLDFELFRKFPKLLLGSSDLTFLLNAVVQKSGLVTFHGPVPSVGYDSLDAFSLAQLRGCIFGSNWQSFGRSGSGGPWPPLLPSGCRRTVGGNLTVLASMIGTPFEPDFNDAAVFLEDVNEPPYRIDRTLTSLLLSGRLARAACIVFGSFENCCREAGDEGLLHELQEEAGRMAGVPVLTGAPFGHRLPDAAFPLGTLD